MKLTAHDFTVILAGLGVLLATARFLGEQTKKWLGLAVVGEIAAGIILGPTFFGRWAPQFQQTLFPPMGPANSFLHGFALLAAVFFLLVAGLEVELSRVRRQNRTALLVTLSGIILPFGVGYLAALPLQAHYGEIVGHADVFPLFFATALSISALPVIARTLMDLKLFRTDFGMTIMAAAMVEDLVGWMIFALILGLIGRSTGHGSVVNTLALTVAFTIFMLTAFRWLTHRLLPTVGAGAGSSGRLLSALLGAALLGAATTEWIGVHAVFGSFLAGVAIGDSTHLKERTRTVVEEFVGAVFAPLFFSGIGLRVDFIAHFDPLLTVLVLVVACLGKVLGCFLGARLGGMRKAEAWGVGFAMNARGAMEIILGAAALEAGIIGEPMFVALVVMALATSMISGPAIKRILGTPVRRFANFIPEGGLVRTETTTWVDAITTLARALAPTRNLDPAVIIRAVTEREAQMSTILERGIMVPQARVEGLTAPLVGVALAARGIEVDSPDGQPARAIVMILVPPNDEGAQIELVCDVVTVLSGPKAIDTFMDARETQDLVTLAGGHAQPKVASQPQSAAPLTVHQQKKGDFTVISLVGQLDLGTTADFQRYVEQLLLADQTRLIIDLGQLQLIDSAGVGALVGLFKRLRAQKGELKVARLGGQPREIFRLLRLEQVFEVLPEV